MLSVNSGRDNSAVRAWRAAIGTGVFAALVFAGVMAPAMQAAADAKGGTVTVSISSTSPSPTPDTPIPFDIDFGAEVFGFTPSDITVVNGRVTSFEAVSGSSYDVEVTPDLSPSTVEVSLAGAACFDEFANPNDPAGPASVDFTGPDPTVALTTVSDPGEDGYISGTAEIRVFFSENVTGFNVSAQPGDAPITNGTLNSFTGTGDRYKIFIDADSDGLVTVTVPAAVATATSDGDPNTPAFFSYIADNTPPTATFTPQVPVPANTTPVVIDLALSEIAYGLNVGDVTVTNGTLDNFDDNGDNINYELTVSPTAEGPVDISIPASTVVDRADLFNNDPLEFSFTYDVSAPSLSGITRLDSSPTNNQTVRYTVAFDEDMTNVSAADFTVVGGSKAVTGASVASVVQIDPQTYRVTVNRGTGAGTLGLNVVTTGAATDLAGNDLSAGGTGPTYSISDLSIDEDLPSIVYAGGEGSDVILEIEASSSVSGLSYQWYQQGGTKAFTPIPSETTSSLFLPMVDPSLEGAQFYVEVSDSLVTENSNIATLTLSEGLPVGSAFGLAALAGLSALGGALTLRRRDQA